MNLHELVEHIQLHISYSRHDDWIVQNGVKLYDIISKHRGNFTILEEYYNVRPLGKLLPKELEEDLSLYYIITDCKLTTNILPPRSQFISSILVTRHFNLISYWIDNGQENLPKSLKSGRYKFKLLLRG